MLQRKIYQLLLDWKANKNRECLLIKGARQIGKTYIVQQFGAAEYESFIEINFASLLRSHFPIPFIFCAIHSVYSGVNLSIYCVLCSPCVCVCLCTCVHACTRSVISDSPHGL